MRPPRPLTFVASCLFCVVLSHEAEAEDPDPATNRGSRIVAEAVGGVAGGALGAVGGGLVGSLGGRGWSKLEYVALGVGVGAFVGAGIGIYIGGRASEGNGNYWATLAGETVGALPGALVVLANPKAKISNVAFVSIFVLSLAGGIAGYELSTKKKDTTTYSTTAGLESQPSPTPLMLRWGVPF